MKTAEDIHPDDAVIRANLRDLLVHHRLRAKLSQRALAARMGMQQSAIAQMERSPQWRVSTLQRWTIALDRRLIVRPLGLPVELDPAMEAFRPTDAAKAAEFDRTAVSDLLVDARRVLGLTQADLGEALGCGDRSVSAVESGANPLLSTWQRYARALGGAVWVGVG